MMYKTYARMDEDKKQMVSDDSQQFTGSLKLSYK